MALVTSPRARAVLLIHLVLTDLSLTPIAETVRRLSADRRTGELQVRSGRVVKTVFFDTGRLVFAASNLKKDRLGEALIAIGRITEHDFERASALMRDRRQRFGDALVNAGVMGKDELGVSVVKQVKRIVLSLFQLTEGAAFFEERVCVIPVEYMVSVSVHQTLYQGIRSMANPQLLLTGIGDLDRRVILSDVPPFKFSAARCSAEEKEILEQARRKISLRKLVVAPGTLAMPRVRAAYALLASGILKRAAPGGDTQPVIQMETGAFLLSSLRKDPTPSPEETVRQEVKTELERPGDDAPQAWLELPVGASREHLVSAIEDKMERFYALLESAGDDVKLQADIETVLGRAAIQLRQAKRSPVASVAEKTALSDAGLPDVEVEEDEAETNFAVSIEDEVPADGEQEVVSPGAAEVGDETTDPAAEERDPEAATAAVPQSDESGQMAGRARMEHMLMEAEVRMTVGDYVNAIKVYQRLVEFVPEAAAYRVKLAIAMAHHPRTAKRAEREFLEAARLEPSNPDLHYQWGLYYKVMKQKSRAIAEFRTALRLKPRHGGARAELEALSPRDSALTSLRKLFQ